MTRNILMLFATFVFLLGQTAFSVAQSSLTSMEKEILEVMEEYKAIGLSVAVVKDGEIAYTKSFGKKNIETDEPLADDHLFRIASISKSFTATGLMQLVEEGKLDLDADFSELVGFPVRNPKFPEKPITLRMVLSHTSSINDSQGYFTFEKIDPSKNPDWAKCYNDYEPGTRYRYCNLNFNMAGAVLERVSDQRFDQYIVAHILHPLGLYGGYRVDALDSTRFVSLYEYNSETKTFRHAKEAYHPRREQLQHYTMGVSTPVFSPTGGMKISTIDLARYMIMHMNYGVYKDIRIIEEASAKEMQKPVLDASGYGLALRNTSSYLPGEDMIGHTGSSYGLYSNMFFHPEKKFGVVLITNGFAPSDDNDRSGPGILTKCARILYHHVIKD